MPRVSVGLEFKPADLWVGVFWRMDSASPHFDAARQHVVWRRVLHIWVCVVPCFPLHIRWVDATELY